MGKNQWLLRATEGGYIKGVTKFLRPKFFGLIKPANVNTRDRDQFTPLIVAALKGYIDIAKLLIEKGADVNAKGNESITPLMASSKFGHQKITALLLENGADVNAANTGADSGWTPLFFAAHNGHTSIVKMCVENGAAVNGKARNSFTPLMAGSKSGVKEIVSFLLEQGAEVNATASGVDMGWTALTYAAWYGHVEIVKELLQKGAKVDEITADFWTPLMWAASEGHVEIVEALLKHGAQVEPIGKEAWTPLLVAARGGYQDIVATLFRHGANMNHAQKDGWTPLMLAAYNGHTETARFLIANGVDIHAKDLTHHTALAIALKEKYRTIADLLVKQGAEPPKKKENKLPEITPKHLSIHLIDSNMMGTAGQGGSFFQAAIQSLNNGNNDEAARHFNKAIKEGLDVLRLGYSYANLGTIQLKKNNLVGAIEDFFMVFNLEQALYESVHDAAQYLYIIYNELGLASEALELQQLYGQTSAKLGMSLSPDMAEKVKHLVKKEKHKFFPIKRSNLIHN